MRFPFYRQLDSMDCGPACLRMIAKYYGKDLSLQYIRKKSFLTREGVSMLGISEAAEHVGFRTKGYRITWEQLRDDVPMPCIIHWNQIHFIIIYDIKKRNTKSNEVVIYVADPAQGLLSYKKEEFLKCWYSIKNGYQDEGVALLIEPAPEFYKQSDGFKKRNHVGYLIGYLRPYRKFILQLGFGILVGSIINFIFPFLTQSIIDYGISNKDLSFIVLVLSAQMTLTLGQTANGLIRNWIMLHVTTRISISLISDFLIKLMRLPIAFFDTKKIGDIMQRIGDHNRIQSFLTQSLIDIIFAILTLLIYVITIAIYSPEILGVFVLSSTIYVLWVFIFMKKRREIDYKKFQQAAINQSNVVQLVTGMQEIKLNDCEKQKRWEWESIQARLFKVSIKGLALNQNQQLGAAFINQIKDFVISFLSAKAVISGNMTLGMMMAVQYIIGQLNAPIHQFIGFIQAAQDAKISLERLDEIKKMESEEKPEDDKICEIPRSGDIKIENLLFQYEGPHSEKVLNNISMTISARKITAIVGMSGSGKTTLLKILLGFYQPVKGKILLNNTDLYQFSQSSWRRNCGVVMQEGFIFSDNIANNIGIIDESPDPEKLEHAAVTSNVKEFIETLPLGYNTMIGNDGHGLSTGQKQRILIARAVYKNPHYIFFDEATNSLDAKNERTIMDNLEHFFKGRTVVIVAHRLSTVKKADNIIVLEKGRIAENGTHQELVAQKGVYYNLVKEQLELGN